MGGSPGNELIAAESIKYSLAKTDEKRQRSLQKIRNYGGERNEFSLNYAVGSAEKDETDILNIFRKKLEKADRYRKSFNNLGLVITTDIPLCISYWVNKLSVSNEGKYDFVVLMHFSGIDLYDFESQTHTRRSIDSNDKDALGKLARMTTEGIIKDEDPVWEVKK